MIRSNCFNRSFDLLHIPLTSPPLQSPNLSLSFLVNTMSQKYGGWWVDSRALFWRSTVPPHGLLSHHSEPTQLKVSFSYSFLSFQILFYFSCNYKSGTMEFVNLCVDSGWNFPCFVGNWMTSYGTLKFDFDALILLKLSQRKMINQIIFIFS